MSVRPLFKTGVAFTLASAIALAPVIATNHHPLGVPVHLPQVSVSEVQLAAVISPGDVAALTANLNAALESAGSTVSAVVDGASHTLTGVLSTATGLTNSLWDQLIAAAGSSPTLKAVLVALKAASGGALLGLSDTVGAVGDAITLTTGQVAEMLTSAVTGTVGTVAQAVASVLNNPLSVSSYIGLLNTPFGAAGLALQSGITGLSQLGVTGLHLANSLVDGVTAQVSNALGAVNSLLGAGKSVTDIALINGTLTAIQGIVSAPVSAAVAGVNGIASAVTIAGVATLQNLASGANAIVGTWLGSGSTPGAIVNAATAIGTAPLSLASYTQAVSVLVGAGVSTVGSLVNTAGAFASLPFRVGADLTGTGAAVVNSLVSGAATIASGFLQAVGLSPLIAGLPNNLATVVTGAINVAALATQTTLNVIASAIDFGHAITGFVTPKSAAVTLATATIPTTAKVDAVVDAGGTKEADAVVDADGTKDADAVVDADENRDAEHGADVTVPHPGTAPAAVGADVEATADPDAHGAESTSTPPTAGGAHSVPQAAVTDQQATADPDETASEKPTSDSADASGTTPSVSKDSDGKGDGTRTVKPKTGITTGTASESKSASGDKSAETYGRHAASPTRSTAAAVSTSSGAETSASESGGRHRRDEGSAANGSTTGGSANDAARASHGTDDSGSHTAGKHAAAA